MGVGAGSARLRSLLRRRAEWSNVLRRFLTTLNVVSGAVNNLPGNSSEF
jgi:hypothetical protein